MVEKTTSRAQAVGALTTHRKLKTDSTCRQATTLSYKLLFAGDADDKEVFSSASPPGLEGVVEITLSERATVAFL